MNTVIHNTKLVPRILVILTVAVALLGGLSSGLARLGWEIDTMNRNWILIHGPLMISGFLGTLICLERAVALDSRYRWSMAVPITNGLGTLALLFWGDADGAKLLLTVGSLGLVFLFGIMLRLHPTQDIFIMALGSLCWLAGNRLWLAGMLVYEVVHLWTAFLILTIVGERLELSRVRRLSDQSVNFLVFSILVYSAGVSLSIFDLDMSIRLLGVGAVLMAGWLLQYDIARYTVRQTGLPRYIASCLLLGYIWLAFGGLIAFQRGEVVAGPEYEMILHAFLLGFVFSMIFGHAPIILPALTGLQVKYTPLFYGHLVFLHVTLVYRMYGNLTNNDEVRQQGGLLNVVAVLLFLMVTIGTVIRSNNKQRQL